MHSEPPCSIRSELPVVEIEEEHLILIGQESGQVDFPVESFDILLQILSVSGEFEHIRLQVVRDVVRDLLDQVSERIDEESSFPIEDIGDDDIDEVHRFPASGVSEDVHVPDSVLRR